MMPTEERATADPVLGHEAAPLTDRLLPAQAAEKRTAEFRNDIVKIAIDKLFIGVLMLVAGTWASNLVNTLQGQRNFAAELNKERVARIGQAWERVNVYEYTFDNAITQLNRLGVFQPSVLPLGPAQRQQYEKERAAFESKANEVLMPVEKAYAEVKDLAIRNRFWLGEDHYAGVMRFADSTENYLLRYHRARDAERKSLEAGRDKLRLGIGALRDALLGEQSGK